MDTEKIIDEIRFITGYPELVFDDEKLEEAIEFTKNEIRGMIQDPEFDDFDEFNAERAVMWGSCYQLKVRTGEIGGLPITIGDVDLAHMRQRGEDAPDVFSWAEKFYENFYRIDDAPLGFGHVRPERDDRSYEGNEVSDYGDI